MSAISAAVDAADAAVDASASGTNVTVPCQLASAADGRGRTTGTARTVAEAGGSPRRSAGHRPDEPALRRAGATARRVHAPAARGARPRGGRSRVGRRIDDRTATLARRTPTRARRAGAVTLRVTLD